MTHSLRDLSVVVLDCQATGANPDKGHLLEVGWATVRAGGHTGIGSDQAPLTALQYRPAQTAAGVVVLRQGFQWGDPDGRASLPRTHAGKRNHRCRIRYRWYCMLSEAALVWSRSTRDSSPPGQMLVFKGGGVVLAQSVDMGDPIVPPMGELKSVRSRQREFDIMTYDRMRILTTELRRLVSEGRGVSLYLGRRVHLDQHRLSGILAWV